ncbi:MAG: flagellar export chaperone FliS [Actinobacteria bacterium]|nr:flagellar export chaperone FliS [Actinomycetota bacterium]OJU79938.1 MAG: flagellar export chaperone FliS [Solirubrobacterales bacterium 70-9]
MNTYRDPSRAYAENSVLTAPPERLVVMLYDGAGRFLARAAAATREGDAAAAGTALGRAGAILDELLATLDFEAGEIAAHLGDIYLFCNRELLRAQIDRDAKRIERVAVLLGGLRESWATLASAPAAPGAGAGRRTALGDAVA